MHRNTIVSLCCLLAVGTLLGLSTVLTELADREAVAPEAFQAWSLLAAGAALTARAWRARLLPTASSHVARYLLIAALVSLAVPNLLLFSAVPRIGAPLVAVAFATPPLWTYLGALALGMERFSAMRAAAVAVSLSGAVLLAALSFGAPDVPIGWLLAALAAPVLLAVGNLYRTADWPPGADGGGLAAGMVAGGGLLVLLICAVVPGLALAVPLEPAALALVAVQAGVFAVLYALFFTLQRLGGPVYLSLVGSVAAVVGSGVAIGLLSVPAPPGLLPGAGLVLLGVAGLTFAGARPAPARASVTSQGTR